MEPRGRSPFLLLALFVLLTALLVFGWQLLRARERAVLEARLDATSMHAAARIEGFLARHVEALSATAQRLVEQGTVAEARFRALSREHQERHPGFLALNWVDADGVIVHVEPVEPNRAALGFDLSGHPFAASALREASLGDGCAVTPPLELLQGGWGVAVYCRVGTEAKTLGFLNGVFRVPSLLEQCLTRPVDGDFVFLLHDGDHLVGSYGPVPARDELPQATYPVWMARRSIELTVLPSPRLDAARGTWTDEALLAVGILLVGALALTVKVSRDRLAAAETWNERQRTLLENAPNAIVLLDPESGRFVDANRRALELFGRSREELAAVGPADVSPARQPGGEPSADAAARHVARALAGEPHTFAWIHAAKDGRELRTEVHLARLPGAEPRLIGSIVDVSARHELEERLRRSQALEAVGQLAGGVAHDFNNILTAVMGAAEMLRQRVQGDAASEDLAAIAVDSCQRAGALTRQLLAFSRTKSLAPQALDLNEIVVDLLPMLQRTLGPRIHLEPDLEPRLGTIVADRSQIEIVVLNLAVNARDAMPRGGCIRIATRRSAAPRPPTVAFGHVPPGGSGGIVIAVQDQGSGIGPGDVERIFEPFFTTKPAGTGTGIGLATVKRAVEQAGGTLRVHSSADEGTSFEVCFPATDGVPAPAAPVPPPEPAPGTGVVLLVEDHDAVRRMTRRVLEAAGYDVLEATDGEAALALAGEGEPTIDALVTDLALPGMSGPELVRALRAERPGLKVLLTSGLGDIEDVARGLDAEHLTKPFSPAVLRRKMRELLSESART